MVTVGETDEVHDSALNTLGTKAIDFENNEYIYLEGVASTVRGTWAVYNGDFETTQLDATDKEGPVAIALAAVVANKFGWYQKVGKVRGLAIASTSTGFVQTDATDGHVDDSTTAGQYVHRARCVTARSGTNGLTDFEIDNPYVYDQTID